MAARPVTPPPAVPLPDDPERNRRQARERGSALLDQLDEVRHGLLMGSIPRAALQRMVATLVLRRTVTVDPDLAALIADIELRALVELAKLETSA